MRLMCGMMLIGAVVWSGVAQAQTASCRYNGVEYPHGTKVGPYTCVNGVWV